MILTWFFRAAPYAALAIGAVIAFLWIQKSDNAAIVAEMQAEVSRLRADEAEAKFRAMKAIAATRAQALEAATTAAQDRAAESAKWEGEAAGLIAELEQARSQSAALKTNLGNAVSDAIGNARRAAALEAEISQQDSADATQVQISNACILSDAQRERLLAIKAGHSRPVKHR
jgi:hypothetical protein